MDNKIEKLDISKTDWKSSREFFQSLEDELRDLDDKDEKYDFTWVGKRKAIIEAGSPINKTLRPDVESSKNWDTTENLYIEGDNLDALKLLQESYLGKVKMIYIDPPYNTGKDFVYHDKFKASVEEYDEATEYKDEEGNVQFKKNEKSNGRFHSDWISMMYPRLKLARNLLRDDGIIFISIDDNEVHNLRKLCDEIFGEENFITNVIWEKKYTRSNDAKWFSDNHDHILVYAKSKGDFTIGRLPRTAEQENAYSNPDNHPKGLWKATPLHAKSGSNSDFSYTFKNGVTWQPPIGTYPRYSLEKLREFDENNEIYFGKDGNAIPSRKTFLKDINSGLVPTTIWKYKDAGHNHESNEELKKLKLGGFFDNPKPVKLLKYSLLVGNTKAEETILDFFSGSSTTAHAVMQLNAEDSGNRKFIMVQLPEPTDEKSEAYKAGYKNICEIGRERIRRAGDKIVKENPEAKVDYGFRSLVITDTNYKEVNNTVDKTGQAQLQETIDNIKKDRSPLDLLFGVLTQLALELNRPLETREIAGNPVYVYDYLGEVSGLIACFSESISEETIKSIAKLKPLVAVFKDSSFPDSQAKINLSEHFKVLSPYTKIKVI